MSNKDETPRARTGVFFVPVSKISKRNSKKIAAVTALLLASLISMVTLPASTAARGGSYTKGVCTLTMNAIPASTTVASGGNINYNLIAKNIGNANCNEVEVTEYYPSDEKYVSSTIKPDAPSFYWNIGTLAPGQTYSLSLTTKNIPDGTSQIANTVCVSDMGTRDICVDNTIKITSSTTTPAPTPTPVPTPVPAPTPVPTPTPTPAPEQTGTSLQGWIYPGNPSCNANKEYTDGRVIDTLKVEYYQVQNNGTLRQITASSDGCNGYSVANVSDLKAHSAHQYATVSGDLANVRALLATSALQNSAITTLTNFAVSSGFTGIELDWEQFDSWSATDYSNFKKFTTNLANSLHAQGKKLAIDAPALTSAGSRFKYEDFTHLDYVVIMAYDYQYDYGVGEPVTPEDWLSDVAKYAKTRLPVEKIVIGIPAYGYHGTIGTYNLTIDTYAQSSLMPGFSTRKINNEGEEAWTVGNTYYSAQPKSSLNRKKAILESLGIKNISVWHLGGNNWF